MKSHVIPRLLVTLGTLGIVDTLFFLSLGHRHLGTWLPSVVGLSLVLWSLLLRHFPRKTCGQPMKRLQDVFAVGVTGMLLFFALTSALILSAVARPSVGNPSWLIVLGAGLKDGEIPGPTLAPRLIIAADYLAEHPNCNVVLSGGKGPDENISEAEAMARYLKDRGVGEERILLEKQSTSTLENLLHSKVLLEKHLGTHPDSVLVLSSDSHLFRVSLLAKRVGLPIGVLAAPSPWYLWPNTLSRECIALMKSLVLDWPT
jgi:uncharacterized SAM-binding protein YcdF (DUF218 family)